MQWIITSAYVHFNALELYPSQSCDPTTKSERSALDPLDLQLLFDFASRGQEMKKIVDMINYEIEYVLRPHTAPARFKIQLSS